MNNYNYIEAMKADIHDFIDCEVDLKEHADREELEEYLNDTLWTVDSVTGNASGSYTFNTWQAEEYIAHNLDLLREAMNEFGCGDGDYSDLLEKGAEACDVTIRCYLLGQAISEVLDELEEENRI